MIQPIIYSLVLLLILAAAITWHIKPRFARPTILWLANNALIVNITPKGRGTAIADAAFTSRYLLCARGANTYSIQFCTASLRPFGVVPDMTPTTDTDLSYPLPYNILGLNEDTERMIAAGAITVDNIVVAAAAGQVQQLTGLGNGSYWVVGKAKTAAAAQNDQIEVVPCFPYQVTMTGTTVTFANP